MTVLRPILCAALAAAALLPASATAAAAPPRIGIGEQHPQMFTDPAFQNLNVRDARFIAVLGRAALRRLAARRTSTRYLLAAHAAGVRVLLGFGHSRDPAKAHDLPSVRAFEREVVKFRARYPWIRDYLTWNEANHCSQPTCNNPERDGAVLPDPAQALPGLPDRRRRTCSTGRRWSAWVKRFQKAVGNRRVIWGLHNYIDANRFRSTGTKRAAEGGQGRHLVHGDRRARDAPQRLHGRSSPATRATPRTRRRGSSASPRSPRA